MLAVLLPVVRLVVRRRGGQGPLVLAIGVEVLELGLEHHDGQRRGQVGDELGVVGDPFVERLLDPVHLVEEHPGIGGPVAAVARGGPGDQRVDVRGQAGHDGGRRRHVLWTCL